MFEHFAVAHRPARRSRAGLFALCSFAVHGAVVAGLLLSAMWQVDKLRPADTAVVVGGRAGLPALPPGEPAAARRLEKPARRIARDLTQRDARPLPPDQTPDEGGGAAEGTGGNPDGLGGGGIGIGVLPCADPSCSGIDEIAPPAPPAPPAAPSPPVVRANLIEGQRISGDPRISAPEAVRAAMVRDGTDRVVGSFKMCLDQTGRPSTVALLASTGYPVYDDALRAGIKTWRYRPYQLDGTAIAVCTAVTFVYRME